MKKMKLVVMAVVMSAVGVGFSLGVAAQSLAFEQKINEEQSETPLDSAWSMVEADSISVTPEIEAEPIEESSGIPEVEPKKAYLNPINEGKDCTLTLDFPEVKYTVVKVLDGNGKMVRLLQLGGTATFQGIPLHLSHFPSDDYTIEVKAGLEKVSLPFSK